MKRRTFLAVGLAAPLLSACGDRTFSYNYRLKIVVRAGDQLHEGSSVVAVTKAVRPNATCDARCWNGGVRAEAPAVSLGERGYLFGLLGHDGWEYPHELAGSYYLGYLPLRALGRRFPAEYAAWRADYEGSFAALFERVRTVREEVDLEADMYPPLVRFRDLNDPATVEFVDSHDMASAFGPGVVLERCSVQLTDERPRPQIRSTLPWLARLRRGEGGGPLGVALVPHSMTDGIPYDNVGVRTLTYEHFEKRRL